MKINIFSHKIMRDEQKNREIENFIELRNYFLVMGNFWNIFSFDLRDKKFEKSIKNLTHTKEQSKFLFFNFRIRAFNNFSRIFILI